ncbi:hypothetical protein [Gracilibacillus massiliensis]|nr:hypothetical protein [Gracilibacillus massiliensis]
MENESNKWIQDQNRDYIEQYVNDLSNVILVERETTISILLNIFS